MATNSLNSTSGNLAWDVASNWSLGTVPQASDDVVITGAPSASLSVTIAATDPAYTVNSLSETTSNTTAFSETLNVNGQLTVTGASTIYTGSMSIFGSSKVTLSSLTLSASAEVSVSVNASGALSIGSVAGGTSTTSGTILAFAGGTTIGSVTGTVTVEASSGAVATVGTTDGEGTFELEGGLIKYQATATTLGDYVLPAGAGGIIDLTSIAYQLGETYAFTQKSSGVGYYIYDLKLLSATGQTLYDFQNVFSVGSIGSQTTPTVNLASDGSGGTLVTLACYGRGTLIAVPGGERPVEALAIGDVVVTASGALRPIRWIGWRSYAGPFLRFNERALPIRFRAGSLGDGLPRRDLLVSPEHAMFLEGVLVPARCLIDGAGVVRDEGCERVDYFHVELDSHDVILAEGAASETFVDDNSRMVFHNAHEFASLYPGVGRPPAVYCAERVEDGPELAAIRQALRGRAGLGEPAAGLALRGFVDAFEDGVLSGWAQEPGRPEAPVCLAVAVDGRVVAHTVADLYRPDLRAAGLGSGRHAFRVRLKRLRGAGGMLEVRRASDGAVLGRLADPGRKAA